MKRAKMTKEEQAERKRARRQAEAALGLRPPPARADPASLNLSANQRKVLARCKNDLGKSITHGTLQQLFGKRAQSVARVMVERDLIEFVSGFPGYRQTEKGRVAYTKAMTNKFRKGVWRP